MKKALIFSLVFLATACASQSVTEPDRILEDQTEKAAQVIHAFPELPAALQQPASDILANMQSLQKSHGLPQPENRKPYSSQNSQDARKNSESSHTSSALLGMLGLAGLWLVREVGTRWCPLLGPLVNMISPKLNNGVVANEHSAVASMEVIDVARKLIPKESQDEFKNTMDRIFSRYGVSVHASDLYEKYVKV